MSKTQKMPDLFVVMNNEELKEAIGYAKENGAEEATIYEGIQYYLSVNGMDVKEFLRETSLWFPMFTDYIELSTFHDKIGILLSPTVWNHYDLNLLYKELEEHQISYKKRSNGFVDKEDYENYKEQERIFSLEVPINSPWTARDIEVVETSLESIENIRKAIIICDANFELVCNFCFLAGIPTPMQLPIAKFSYPNVMHLETDNGDYNVYMGETVNLNSVTSLLNTRKIECIIKEYQEEDANLLFYQSRNRIR